MHAVRSGISEWMKLQFDIDEADVVKNIGVKYVSSGDDFNVEDIGALRK